MFSVIMGNNQNFFLIQRIKKLENFGSENFFYGILSFYQNIVYSFELKAISWD